VAERGEKALVTLSNSNTIIDAVLLFGVAVWYSNLKFYTFPSGPGVVFNEFAPPALSVAARIKVYQRFMIWKSLPELALAVDSESRHHVLFAVPASEIQQIDGLHHDH
jgi:hypothetical protein